MKSSALAVYLKIMRIKESRLYNSKINNHYHVSTYQVENPSLVESQSDRTLFWAHCITRPFFQVAVQQPTDLNLVAVFLHHLVKYRCDVNIQCISNLWKDTDHHSSTEVSSNSDRMSLLLHHVIFLASTEWVVKSQTGFLLLAGFMLPNFKCLQHRCQCKSSLSKLSLQSLERNGHF